MHINWAEAETIAVGIFMASLALDAARWLLAKLR